MGALLDMNGISPKNINLIVGQKIRTMLNYQLRVHPIFVQGMCQSLLLSQK